MPFLPFQIMLVPPIYCVCLLASFCKQKQTFKIISNKTHWRKDVDDKLRAITRHHQASPTKQKIEREKQSTYGYIKAGYDIGTKCNDGSLLGGKHNEKEHQSKTSIEGVLEEAMASNEAQEVNRFVVREVVWVQFTSPCSLDQ